MSLILAANIAFVFDFRGNHGPACLLQIQTAPQHCSQQATYFPHRHHDTSFIPYMHARRLPSSALTTLPCAWTCKARFPASMENKLDHMMEVIARKVNSVLERDLLTPTSGNVQQVTAVGRVPNC
jgi:hypothetical protein